MSLRQQELLQYFFSQKNYFDHGSKIAAKVSVNIVLKKSFTVFIKEECLRPNGRNSLSLAFLHKKMYSNEGLFY